MRYRRVRLKGGTYFFTLVTFERRPFLCEPESRDLLRHAFDHVRKKHPFTMDAVVLLPEHLHCLWTLPPGDCDYSTRWRLIKQDFTRRSRKAHGTKLSESRRAKGEETVWQRRFWEHTIRDEVDLDRHIAYIHYNPVKHGLVRSVEDWPHSSFHSFVSKGCCDANWTPAEEDEMPDMDGME